MLKEEEYFKFIIKQEKMLTDEIKEAIKEQTRLSKIAHEMQDHVMILKKDLKI